VLRDADLESFALRGHGHRVTCLCLLPDGRVASGSGDASVRVSEPRLMNPVLELITNCYEYGDVEALVEATVRKGPNFLCGLLLGAAEAIVRNRDEYTALCADPEGTRARLRHHGLALAVDLFDATEELVRREHDVSRRDALLKEALLPCVHSLANDREVLTELATGPALWNSDAADRLAATLAFSTVLEVKYRCGPCYVYYFEIFVFAVLMGSYLLLCHLQLGSTDARTRGAQLACCASCLCAVSYFAVVELFQVIYLRQLELGIHCPVARHRRRNGLGAPLKVPWPGVPLRRGRDAGDPAADGGDFDFDEDDEDEEEEHSWPQHLYRAFAFYCVLPLAAAALWPATWLLASRGGWRRCARQVRREIDWDPLTFFGAPRAWRNDYWNVVDLGAITIVATVCSWTLAHWAHHGEPPRLDRDGAHSDHNAAYLNLCVVGAMILWMKTLGFLKAFSIKFATFVLMLEQTVRDIQPFLVVLAVFLFAFATVFHLRLAGWDHDRFHFHDDGELNPFRSVKDLLQALVMLAFVGDFDYNAYPRGVDVFWLDCFLFVMIVVMLNVLIAIVCDSYTDAVEHGDRLFWRARLEQLTEIRVVWGRSLIKLGWARTNPADVLVILQQEFENDVAEESKAEGTRRRIIHSLRHIRDEVDTTTQALGRVGDLSGHMIRMSADFDARMSRVERHITDLDAKFDRVLELAEARTRAITTHGAQL